MVERGERPDFQAGAPEIEKAPNFSEGDRSSNPEQDPAVLRSATHVNSVGATIPVSESHSLTGGESVAPSHDQVVGFKEIPNGENTLVYQDTVDAVFEREASSE